MVLTTGRRGLSNTVAIVTRRGAAPRSNLDASGKNLKLHFLLGGVILALTGCAADTMRGYVGRDIRAVELANGPPANQIDLGGGTRAFQWRKISVDTTPMSAVTTSENDRKGRKTTETQFVGGQQTVTDCLYTFIATWNPQQNSWIVSAIRQPSLDCAIGGLN
jgi:hypothetical protein